MKICKSLIKFYKDKVKRNNNIKINIINKNQDNIINLHKK